MMRTSINIDKDWKFYIAEDGTDEQDYIHLPSDAAAINLPHVWNVADPARRGLAVYQKKINSDIFSDFEKCCVFLDIGAAAGVSRCFLNGEFVGEHRCGYSRFRFDLTDRLKEGENDLVITSDTSKYEDINPLTGDFNIYGGIYRSVQLICTDKCHFDLMHLGSNGIEIKASTSGDVEITSRIVGALDNTSLRYTICDGEEKVAEHETSAKNLLSTNILINSPHLWDGKNDPHMYSCKAELIEDGTVVDRTEIPFAFRSVEMTADKGLLLNGKALKIKGVAKHQDFEGKGSAVSVKDLERDLSLIKEIGANAVRLSHYQHPDEFLDMCDREGILVWAEIPMLAMPDGNEGVFENAKEQLKELVLQQKNHPSIFCWGIQNEIAMMGESLEMYRKVRELSDLVKELDDTRLSACANLYCVKNRSELNHITDFVGYNVYFGWYNGEIDDYDDFMDAFHNDNPDVPLGISEYGVDCSVGFHSQTPKCKDYSEEFQALFHERVYPKIFSRDYIWGSFVWNMFDFGSAIRDEGGVKGKNCKGLVTYDRKTKKDAFYFYKSWWSDEPFVYIAERRFEKRHEEAITIKVYSNLDELSLSVNGISVGTQKGEHVFSFENVKLKEGKNTITVTSGESRDEIVLEKVDKPEESYIFRDPNPDINVKNWFTMGKSEDDLFPEGYYSIMDSLNDLLKSEEAWGLLPKQITENPRSKNGSEMTLLQVFRWLKKEFDENYVKELNGKLNKIKKSS